MFSDRTCCNIVFCRSLEKMAKARTVVCSCLKSGSVTSINSDCLSLVEFKSMSASRKIQTETAESFNLNKSIEKKPQDNPLIIALIQKTENKKSFQINNIL